LPGGLSLNSTTGAIAGTPNSAATSSFTISASDAASDTGTHAYSVTINPAITFSANALPGATANTAYSQQLATAGGTAPLTFAVTTGTLPAGLTLSSGGLLSGTPTTAATDTFTVTATDAAGATATHDYTFVVNPAITFTTTTLPGATVGATYSQQLATTGGTTPLTFAVTTGTLPAGLTLSGTGLLSGTPTAAGAATFTVTATDANNTTATQGYTVTVSPALALTTGTLPAGTVGTPYSQQLAATGGTTPLTFAVTSGTPPTGLTLSTTGLLAGTPTTAGTSTFDVTATDAAGATATATYTVNVTQGTSQGITFTTTTLPPATVGAAYSQPINVTGGVSPITLAVTAGTLPPGLTLSTTGLLAGTPTTAGTATFTITATDLVGTTATQTYTLNVTSSVATTGPTVTGLQRYGYHSQPTMFVLSFSTALDPTSAQNVSNYTLVPLYNGHPGSPIPLASAVYDATNHTVTLNPVSRVYAYGQYALQVNGTSPNGVQDTSGNFLAGANGKSGTNYVTTFGIEILAGPNIPATTTATVAKNIQGRWSGPVTHRLATLASRYVHTTPVRVRPVHTPVHIRTSARVHAAATRLVVHASAPTMVVASTPAGVLSAAHAAATDAALAAVVVPHARKP
jgi:hypothetical protein